MAVGTSYLMGLIFWRPCHTVYTSSYLYHILCMKESCRPTSRRVLSRVSAPLTGRLCFDGHITLWMNQIMLHVWTQGWVTLCDTYEWVLSHLLMSHGKHMGKSYGTHMKVMSYAFSQRNHSHTCTYHKIYTPYTHHNTHTRTHATFTTRPTTHIYMYV